MKTALLFGASGLVGGHLLQELLIHPAYQRVIAVVRRDLPLRHEKLTLLNADLTSLAELRNKLVADDLFIALGTTKKKSPNKHDYYQIDHDYPLLAATLALQQGARTVLLVSAVGADAGSSLFYVRTKGEMERDILALHPDHCHIFRPSMILGPRAEHRPLEKVLNTGWALLNPLLVGKLDKYRGISSLHIARAMVTAAQLPAAAITHYDWREMQALTQPARGDG